MKVLKAQELKSNLEKTLNYISDVDESNPCPEQHQPDREPVAERRPRLSSIDGGRCGKLWIRTGINRFWGLLKTIKLLHRHSECFYEIILHTLNVSNFFLVSVRPECSRPATSGGQEMSRL